MKTPLLLEAPAAAVALRLPAGSSGTLLSPAVVLHRA
jgi:hypothetical protein